MPAVPPASAADAVRWRWMDEEGDSVCKGEQLMATHKFAQGDRVVVRADRNNQSVRPGTYSIVRTMPESSDGLQYRAKNVMDDHERVFRETELVKV